jgi:hypothetical protein
MIHPDGRSGLIFTTMRSGVKHANAQQNNQGIFHGFYRIAPSTPKVKRIEGNAFHDNTVTNC